MINILKQNFRHLMRSRFLILFYLLSILVQFVVLKVVKSATMSVNGSAINIGISGAVTSMLVVQAFIGSYLAALYGIWMAPYIHQGTRSQLVFVLPVSRWLFPIGYVITMGVMVIAQFAAMFAIAGFVLGFEVFSDEVFPWARLLSGLGLELLAFETLMLTLALFSLAFGRIQTFLIGMFMLFVMQAVGAYYRSSFFGASEEQGLVYQLIEGCYYLLPQFGEPIWKSDLVSWLIWLPIFVGLFRYRIRYPEIGPSSE